MLKNNRVYITTVATLDTEVFYHWLKYYIDIGVDDIFINLWGDSSEINFEEIISIMREFGIKPFTDFRDVNVFEENFKTKMFNDAMSTLPEDWWIPVDSDEFIFFPNDLQSEVQYNIDNDFDYTFGLLVDRISEDGTLKELKITDDILSKFPLVGNVTMELKGNEVWIDKVSLIRGSSRVINGIHGIENVNKEKISDVITQHHHFKWTSKTIENLKRQYSGLKNNNHGWYTEYKKLLSYFEDNNGIDVKNPKFMLEEWNNEWSNWEKFKKLDIMLKNSDEFPGKRHIWNITSRGIREW